MRIEGDDTDLKRLLAALFSSSATQQELVVGELPSDFPPDFPVSPDWELLGSQSITFAGFGGSGRNGTAVYVSGADPEATVEAIRDTLEAAGWFEPDRVGFFGPPANGTVYGQFCPDDWERSGRSINIMASSDGASGSYLSLSYTVGQNQFQCDPDAMGAPGFEDGPPEILFELQGLRPEGSEPDFRFGGGFSSSGSEHSTTFGFRFDGGALTVARFFQQELEGLAVTVGEPLGDDVSAVLALSLTDDDADAQNDDRSYVGWVLVTRLDDVDEVDESGPSVMHINVTLVSLTGDLRSGFSTSGTFAPLR